MLAAVMEEIGKPLVVKDVPDPELMSDGVIIKVEANGICRSDWHLWMGHFDWLGLKVSVPHVFGHELSGVIVEAGANVKNFRKNDRVVVPVCCGEAVCEMCRRGHSHLCENPNNPGVHYSGGFGEYVHVSLADFNLSLLPENVGFIEAAAMGCRFATAFHGILDRAKVQGGEWVTVVGCGGLGLAAVQISAALGAKVIAVDIDEEKLKFAEQSGAVAKVNAKKENVPEAVREITKGGAHVSIDALGISDTAQASVMSLRKRGRHLQLGLTTEKEQGFISLPMDLITAIEADILGSYGSPSYRYADMLDMVDKGILQPKKLITGTISVHEINKVFEKMANYETKGIIVLDKWQ